MAPRHAHTWAVSMCSSSSFSMLPSSSSTSPARQSLAYGQSTHRIAAINRMSAHIAHSHPVHSPLRILRLVISDCASAAPSSSCLTCSTSRRSCRGHTQRRSRHDSTNENRTGQSRNTRRNDSHITHDKQHINNITQQQHHATPPTHLVLELQLGVLRLRAQAALRLELLRQLVDLGLLHVSCAHVTAPGRAASGPPTWWG